MAEPMTPESWQQINDVLDAVLALPAEEQQAYLDAHCPDEDVRREVASLLEAHHDAETFLEEPADAFAAPFLPDVAGADPLVGQEIDGFRVLRVVGRGGMGIVYEAEDVGLARRVALKMIDPALARDATFVRRFQGEGRSLALIDSPHIVRVYALRQTEAGVFIVMEFVEGGTVKDLLDGGPLPWARAAPIAREMLTALEAAHSVGVIHRDIKPGNILLTKTGTVKVTDFGLAKLFDREETATLTQGIAGTLNYMAPEQVLGRRDLDPRTDLYAVGITIYRMLAGRLPYPSDASDYAVMRAIAEGDLPTIDTVCHDLPKGLAATLAKALATAPADRFQSAAEMRAAFDRVGTDEALDAFVPPEKTPPPKTEPPPEKTERPPEKTEPPPEPPRRRYVYAALGVLLLVGAVGGGVALWPSEAGEGGDPPAETAWVELSSTPGDARVLINGVAQGQTDAEGRLGGVEVPPGSLLVVLEKDGHESWSETRVAAAGDTLRLAATLPPDSAAVAASNTGSDPADDGPDTDNAGTDNEPPPQARLVLRTEPAGATIRIDGVACRAGATCTAAPGRKTVTFSHPAYGTFTERLTARAGRTTEQTFYFEQVVNVAATPSSLIRVINQGTGADESSGAYTPNSFRLGPGTYDVRVQKDGYEIASAEHNGRAIEASAVRITVPGFQERHRIVFQIRPR